MKLSSLFLAGTGLLSHLSSASPVPVSNGDDDPITCTYPEFGTLSIPALAAANKFITKKEDGSCGCVDPTATFVAELLGLINWCTCPDGTTQSTPTCPVQKRTCNFQGQPWTVP